MKEKEKEKEKDRDKDKPGPKGKVELAPIQEAPLRIILNSMVEAVFVTDDKGRITLSNEALDRMMGRDVRGERAKDVIENKALRVAIRRARKKDKATDVEIEGLFGRARTFHAQVAPLPAGFGVVTVLHDVSSLKEADRIRRDFVANASHELRTPLTAIRGFAETLRDGAVEDPAARQRFLDAILRHTLRLSRLVEDLAMLSQAESPQQDFAPSPTDVAQVVRESAASLESFARKKNIRVRLDLPEGPAVVAMNARALEHVLINLIENAIKYSPVESEIFVALRRSPTEVVFEVKDRGIGIPAKYHDRIFERFYRVDKGRSREEGGTGLGLAIVRHLVSRMGGTVELESEPDRGACFRVTVPLDEEVEPPPG